MKTRHILFLAVILIASQSVFSQAPSNIQQATSINTDGSDPDASALLDVQSTAHGVLVPRMTSAQRTAIASPATGLLVFDTTTGSFWFYQGGGWKNLSTPAGLADQDNDTKVQVEESPDEDQIRFDLGGNEMARMDGKTFHLIAPGNSLFIGNDAGLSDDSTANWNVFVGPYAGDGTTSGERNVFLGFDTGGDNVTGSENVFVGTEAGLFNQEGSENTFVGDNAGFYNSSGNQNVLIGENTGAFNDTLDCNTAVGAFAGEENETGSHNTFIGKGAGRYAGGSGNVFLGHEAGMDETGSNKLIIDNSPADSSNALIYGEFDNKLVTVNGSLGIGTTAPIAKFQVDSGTVLFEGFTGETPPTTSTYMHRMMWIPAKAAFRAGIGQASHFGDANIGLYSAAFGEFNKASGENAFAAGGRVNTASGYGSSVVSGSSNTASGTYSFVAGGFMNDATSFGSFVAGGSENHASGVESFVGGSYQGFATGENSFIGGGTNNEASGKFSFTGGGLFLEAPSYAEAAFGIYNTEYTPNGANFSDPEDRLFVIGNGWINARSNAFTVLKKGYIGIGIDTPAVLLHNKINAEKDDSLLARTALFLDNSAQDGTFPDSANSVALVFGENGIPKQAIVGGTYGNDYINFYTGSDFTTPRMRLDNAGLGVGRSPATNKLEVEGNASKSSAGDWLANSDARLKKNIRSLDADEMLRQLLDLQGITYESADDKTGTWRPEGVQYGFTAQNVQKVFPQLVEEDNAGYLQTAYGTYDAMTVEAIRALNDKIEGLRSENAGLRKQNVQLNDRLAMLEAAIFGTAESVQLEGE